jgi:hypothetical protein
LTLLAVSTVSEMYWAVRALVTSRVRTLFATVINDSVFSTSRVLEPAEQAPTTTVIATIHFDVMPVPSTPRYYSTLERQSRLSRGRRQRGDSPSGLASTTV